MTVKLGQELCVPQDTTLCSYRDTAHSKNTLEAPPPTITIFLKNSHETP